MRLSFFSRVTALLSVTALTACTVGPDYHAPPDHAPAQYHQSVTPAADHPTQAALDPQWWRLYNDPVLTQLEADVARSNLDLRTAALNLAESTAERRIASAAQMPRLDGAASYARERASTNGILGLLGTTEQASPGDIASGAQGFGPAAADGAKGNPSFNLPQYGLSASWEVDFWGHVRRQVEAATAAMHATEDMQRNVLVSLMAETAQDYIALRNVQAQIAITQQSIEIAHHSVDLTTLRFTQGTATKLDVAYSRGQMHSFEARLPPLKSQSVHLINALSFLVAREPGALASTLNKPGIIPPVPTNIPTGLPSQLADRRPDIRAAKERLHAATASIGVAIADFYPRITLSGSLDIQALQFSGLGSWASRQYGFGPTMTLPLFEGGRLTGQLHLRKAQQKEAAIALQRTILRAWEEIDDAMTDLSTAQDRQKRLEESVTENETAVHIAQLQYSQGAGDFLNVLTAQNALLATRSALSEARAGVSVSMTHLYRALGGGWEGSL
ncbi:MULTISPECIES: efflux transporter outer membrane subunit [Gluconobacter]|uniref:efflux transporter outer membrane subunit n=1 Tax=Gluconobacter TaxID=441 RepID=UPI001B8ADCA4|nr:efflux transporter outer membrane subunit [Gluconobacter cerinus]MBS1031363.1 efflux transporter outer membrane subunit [Gluconobacter cerinus]MBS1069105.1 efflux transporter outer membrane subunit [Gluconobacter cerinus]